MNRLGWVFILPFLTACAWSESRVSQQPRTTAPSGITSPTGYFDYLEVLNGGIFNSYGNSTFGNNPNFDKVTMQAYIYGNLIPDASPSTVSSLGSDARPWTAKLRDATANNLFVNEYVNIGREDTQRGILRLFGGASNPPVMYWYNSDNVDSPENYWYAYPWGEVFFFYPSTGSPNGFTYTALGQFQCNQASFTQQLYAANIKSSTGTNTFGGNATLGGNTLTAGAVTWTTGTGTFGAAGKTANFPGSVQAAHIKSSTGTNTFGGAVQSTGDHIASGAAVYYRNAADNALVRFSGGTDFNTAHLSIHGDQRTTNPGSTSWWHGGTGGTFDIASTLSLGYITKAAAFNTHMSMDNRGNFAFNTNDLVIDATNNRVGIQKASPAYTLDVDGTLNVTGNVTLGDAVGDSLKGKGHNYGFPESIVFAEESIAGASQLLGLAGFTTHTKWTNNLGRTVYVTKFDTIAYESAAFSSAPVRLRKQLASGYRTTLITNTYGAGTSGTQIVTEQAKNATYAIANGVSLVIEVYSGGSGDSFDALWARVIIQEDTP